MSLTEQEERRLYSTIVGCRRFNRQKDSILRMREPPREILGNPTLLSMWVAGAERAAVWWRADGPEIWVKMSQPQWAALYRECARRVSTHCAPPRVCIYTSAALRPEGTYDVRPGAPAPSAAGERDPAPAGSYRLSVPCIRDQHHWYAVGVSAFLSAAISAVRGGQK